MEIVFSFLKENYALVIYIGLVLIEIVIVIAKPRTKTDSLKEKILSFLPFAINLTEQLSLNLSSKEKLLLCLETVKSHFDLDNSKYDEFIVKSVESILNTPKKKAEGSKNEK